ncbi:hypothetical protein BDD12DRAFT_809906 [Trichophaea hybrida]|nr:hypothetical protein BDD12DRAFT_809906 [Trichophaea hybrida]
MTQELIKFSEQLANQTTNMMDVIRQMLEKMTTEKGSKADKCGCTLNGKEPDKFTGKNPEDFLPWITRVDNYIGEQLHRISTARDVRVFMFSLLDENALEYAIESCPRGQPDPNTMEEGEDARKREEYEAIMSWLSQNFSDTLLTQKLIMAWEQCYQNEEKFQTWVIHYERLTKRAGLIAPGGQRSEAGACHDLWRRLKKSLKEHISIKEIKDHGTYPELRQKCLFIDGYLPPGEKYRGREQRKETTKQTKTARKYTPEQLEKLREKAKGTPCSCRLWGDSEIDPTGRRGQEGRRDRKVGPADRDGRGKKHKNGSEKRRGSISHRYKRNRSLDRLRSIGQHLHRQDGPKTPTPQNKKRNEHKNRVRRSHKVQGKNRMEFLSGRTPDDPGTHNNGK